MKTNWTELNMGLSGRIYNEVFKAGSSRFLLSYSYLEKSSLAVNKQIKVDNSILEVYTHFFFWNKIEDQFLAFKQSLVNS